MPRKPQVCACLTNKPKLINLNESLFSIYCVIDYRAPKCELLIETANS